MSKKLKHIRPSLNLMPLSSDALVARANSVKAGIDNNPAFPHPPVDAATLGATIDSYLFATAEGLDSKKARAVRDERRLDLIRMLRQIGHYVEANCKNDLTTLLSSGFEPIPPRATAQQPLPPAAIVAVEQGGNSGQLLVYLKPLPKARHYEIKYTPAGGGGAPGSSAATVVPSAKAAVPIENLTPGTTYTFQVRAYGKLGFTDWSDPVSRMCI